MGLLESQLLRVVSIIISLRAYGKISVSYLKPSYMNDFISYVYLLLLQEGPRAYGFKKKKKKD